MKKPVKVIFACTAEGGIGKDGKTPWRIKEDMDYFRTVTTATQSKEKVNAVVMGRVTWDSIPLRFRPLENRLNVVLSSTLKSIDGALVFGSLEEALSALDDKEEVESIFICGGADLYNKAMAHPRCSEVYLTMVLPKGHHIECDRFVKLEGAFDQYLKSEEVGKGSTEKVDFIFRKYCRVD